MHFEMLHPTASSSSSSSATDDKDKSAQLSTFNVVSKQMAEFQKVVDNYRIQQIFSPINSPPPGPPPTSPAPPQLLLSDEDGYLHPEVGIDHELERLLAENPGLFMTEDNEEESEKMTVHVPSPQRR